ncbi:retrovirus-related Pol polyprotein from transposon 17.6 [Trichonephila clavipes]|nr:retrovirus-related Pol polyprotein from transposon 17.6 [Trichonephila clavipes]
MKIITVNNYEDFSSDFPVSQDILPPLTEKDFNLSGLDSKIKNRLFQLLISHKSAFARSTVELSVAATEHHRISLQHDYPIKCPIYKIPFNLRNEFRRQIADLEKAGIISKSNSQYNTPALFVKQKEKWRLVLDFHMKSAFNQIPLHFADRHKTAFSTPDGDKYEFNRLCFGLKNSPKAFQSIAQEVLGDLLHNGALVYIDDIILFTKTIDEHFELLDLSCWVENLKFLLDDKPLAGFLSNKNPSSKILRWKLALEEFNYDIHYIRGSLNSVADHLSRCINNITIVLPDSKDLIKMQHEDPVLSPIIQKIDQNDVSPQVSNYFINGEVKNHTVGERGIESNSNTTRFEGQPEVAVLTYGNNCVLLNTFMIFVKSADGYRIKLRGLLDNASTICVMREDIARKLGFKFKSANQSITGINGITQTSKYSANIEVSNRDYTFAGHMEEIKNETLDKINYYIPHHSVYKPEKTSTPLRVVFDVSAKTTSGFSLNSILLNGGIIQQDLFSIVSRFRKHEYAFSAYIKKMYRQILVDPNQRDLQRIMWKTSADAPVKTYKLATVTYGTVSAPFLATRTLRALADEKKSGIS